MHALVPNLSTKYHHRLQNSEAAPPSQAGQGVGRFPVPSYRTAESVLMASTLFTLREAPLSEQTVLFLTGVWNAVIPSVPPTVAGRESRQAWAHPASRLPSPLRPRGTRRGWEHTCRGGSVAGGLACRYIHCLIPHQTGYRGHGATYCKPTAGPGRPGIPTPPSVGVLPGISKGAFS